MNKLLSATLSHRIVLNSLKISLVVGTLLNLINHGENMLHGDTISWFYLMLNYLVPYCVASYSAAKNELEQGDIHDEQT